MRPFSFRNAAFTPICCRCAMLEKLPDSIGHALQGQRAGLSKILFNKLDLGTGVAKLTVSSPAFADHAPIPARFTADAAVKRDAAAPVSPPLRWQDVPEAATTLALIVEDADSPTPEPLVHAVVVDIDPTLDGLLEGELRQDDPDSPVNLDATPTCNRAGCRLIRRRATGSIVTRSSCSP
jgi:hypothetical protein